MKNVITKFAAYKEYGLFNHIYLLDVDYVFNEKSVEDIMEFIKNECAVSRWGRMWHRAIISPPLTLEYSIIGTI